MSGIGMSERIVNNLCFEIFFIILAGYTNNAFKIMILFIM
jgi:hypothetical protein